MSQTTDHHDSALTMSSDVTFAPTLPQTVAQRRNARLRAAALQAIPLLLFLFAAALRLWEPDLVPFGARQAEYVAIADSRSPLQAVALYLDVSRSPLTLVWPLLRELPQSVVLWVILRGLLDSLGVALLFLAARPLVGVWGATLAALLYAVNPWVWAAARDPAGPLTPLLVAASLYGAVRLVARPTMLNGAVLGVLLGLLARSVSPGLIVVLLGASALAVARASWKVGGATALALVIVSAPVLLAPLPPLNTRDLLSGYPLALPAWLMEGHLYPYLGETPYGWVYWAPIRLLWPSGSVVRAQWPWAYGLSPTLLLSLCAAGLSLYLIRRGRTVLWLPLAWALAWAMIAYPLFQPNPAGVSPYIRTILSLAGAVGLAPALALLLAAPVGARERVIRWIGVLVVAVMLLPSGYSLIQEMRLVADAERARQAFVEPPLDSVIPTQPYLSPDGQLARTPSLRDMASVARALRGTAARLERLEFVQPYSWVYEYVMPHAWALDSIYAAHRAMPAGAVPLPLERETAYLVASGHVPFHPPSVELQRPASSMIVFTPDGADTGARVVTLRPRGVADWTAGATPVSDGRFNDGSRLVAASRVSAVNGSHGLHLYWELPAAADGRSVGESVLVLAETPAPGGLTPRGQKLPPVALRRGGELIAFRASMPPESRSGTAASPRLVVRLLDAAGNPIRRPDGSTQLVLPIN